MEEKILNNVLIDIDFREGGDYFALDNLPNHKLGVEVQDISVCDFKNILKKVIKETEKNLK